MTVDSGPNIRLLKAVVIILGIAIVVVLGIIVVTVISRLSGGAVSSPDPTPAVSDTAGTAGTGAIAPWPEERVLDLPPGLGEPVEVRTDGQTLVLRFQQPSTDTVLVFVDLASGTRLGVMRLVRQNP